MARRYDEFPGARKTRARACAAPEGLVQARRLRGLACGRARHARAHATIPSDGLVAGRGQASAGRLLPRGHALGHRHAVGAERGRRALRQRRVPQGLGRRAVRRKDRPRRLPHPAARRPSPTTAGTPSPSSATTAYGFWILNSWGTKWGTGGLAVLSYEDWLENAMDCWVAQLGVATALHRRSPRRPRCARAASAARCASRWPATRSLRNREISPFVINMENNGAAVRQRRVPHRRSPTSQALVHHHLDEFRASSGIGAGEPVDIAIYAHGGLTGEETAAATAARWIPALYEAQGLPHLLHVGDGPLDHAEEPC